MALSITIKEYVTFRKEGYSVDEIAKKFNLQSKQLKSWVYNHRVKIDKALEGVTIPEFQKEKVLRSKDIPEPEQPKPTFAPATAKSVPVDKNTETFSKIKDKLAKQKEDYEKLEQDHKELKDKQRRQNNDYELLQKGNQELSEMYHSLKADYEAQSDKLRAAENKVADIDLEYQNSFKIAKQEWDDQYRDMKLGLEQTIRLKESTIKELSADAEQLAQADDEIESLKDQLEAAQETLQRAFEESERYRTMYEKEVVPLRQLALIKLEADCSAQLQ
ncbi:hypothetical protein [Terribacillus saccharophilus]|uniref:hypothetical protein n=1 Tax=Terribacillus saccharophilus TaxID=361277 RepID=UPI003981F8B1